MSHRPIIIDPRSPRRFWRFAIYFYILGILFFTMQPDYSAPEAPRWVETFKNFLHIPAYAGLAYLMLCVLGKPSLRNRLWAFAGAVFYGGVNEIFQSFVPGRTCSWEDLGRNALGAFLVVIMVRRDPAFSSVVRINRVRKKIKARKFKKT